MHVGDAPLHAGAGATLPLEVAVAAAGLGSLLLVTAGAVAYRRRGRWSHLVVVLAIATLFGRAAMAALSMGGLVGDVPHHVAEHALDLLAVALVFVAVAYARRVERTASEVGGRE